MKTLIKEFREFALKGNVVDMAVGIIIGGAFSTIVRSLVDDVIMPPVGILLGNVDFQDLFIVLRQGNEALGPYPTIAAAQEAGAVTLNYGVFINNVISFLILAGTIFMVIRLMNQVRKQNEAETPTEEPDSKDCPFCLSAIPLKATRCPQCTSMLED